MFGLIRKKKVKKALQFLDNEYNTSKQTGVSDYYFACGNVNAVNYISSKLFPEDSIYSVHEREESL